MKKYHRHLISLFIAVVVTFPGIYQRVSGYSNSVLEDSSSNLGSVIMVAVFAGAAILAASFLLLWACDAAQADISQTLAIAVVALLAVLPEYAVDMYFTWQAGQFPDGPYAHYAIANMTGANRLLIGVAWVVIIVIFYIKTRLPVRIGTDRRTELFFLGVATLYAFFIPIKGTLSWYDGLVFLALYAWYIVIASKRPVGGAEAEGPSELIINLARNKRRLVTLLMFLFAGFVILANAEPFSEGLVTSGKRMNINEFLLVQWLAPIASEAPEFTVAIMFALRGQAGLALGSLLSSKLNQWTLLVGMIPGVYALSSKQLIHPIPMNSFQMHEILLTAAQSLMAVVLLGHLRITIWQGLLLFALFIGQFVAPPVVEAFPRLAPFGLEGENVHQLFSIIYVAIAIALYLDRPARVQYLWRGVLIKTAEPAIITIDEGGVAGTQDETTSSAP